MSKFAVVIVLTYLLTAVVANTTTARLLFQKGVIQACQNLTGITTPDPECWDVLDMTEWMTDWNTTTTTCTQAPHLPDSCQCEYQEPWAQCFMRLTFLNNDSAQYQCTNISTPQNCTMPVPGTIVAAPPEIYYGAYSIWSLLQYMNTWMTALTSPAAIPAISAQLSNPKSSALSASTLLKALVTEYAIDTDLGAILGSVVTNGGTVSESNIRPILSNVQTVLANLLQSTMTEITSDWSSGDFIPLASGGKLLNGTGEMASNLEARFGGR